MKKVLAITAAALLAAAPVSAQDWPERPFLEYATDVLEYTDKASKALQLGDWGATSQHLQEMALWSIAEAPEACYAYLWGVASTFSATSALVTMAVDYGADDALISEMNAFLAEVNAVQAIVTSGPTVEC